MDAGLAALLGAVVGSLASVGAAFVSGRAQARSQYAQWRREQRRDAYVALLGALHDRDLAMDEILAALRERADPYGLDGKVERFVRLAREVHRAVEVVLVEGPPAMADAVSRVNHASEDLSEVVRGMVADAKRSGEPAGTDELDLAQQREHRLYQTIVDLRAEAAKILDAST